MFQCQQCGLSTSFKKKEASKENAWLFLKCLLKCLFSCFTCALGNNSTEVCTDIAVFTKASDAHLSQEECGLKLIIMDESRISNDSGTLDLEPETMSGEHI